MNKTPRACPHVPIPSARQPLEHPFGLGCCFHPWKRLRMELRMQETPRMSGRTADPHRRDSMVS